MHVSSHCKKHSLKRGEYQDEVSSQCNYAKTCYLEIISHFIQEEVVGNIRCHVVNMNFLSTLRLREFTPISREITTDNVTLCDRCYVTSD